MALIMALTIIGFMYVMRMFAEKSKQPLENILIEVTWPHFKVLKFSKYDSTGHSEKKRRMK